MTVNKAPHLVFVEDRNQAYWIKKTGFFTIGQQVIVAVSADAQQALEEYGITCTPIGTVAGSLFLSHDEERYIRDLYRLVQEIDDYIGQKSSCDIPAGPAGVLVSNYYVLQYTISAIAKRFLLMKAAILYYAPEKITVFGGYLDDWFSGYNYRKNPWIDCLGYLSRECQFEMECLQIPLETYGCASRGYSERLFHLIGKSIRRIRRGFGKLNRFDTLDFQYDGLRLVFIDSEGYDWEPVIDLLKTNRNIHISRFNTRLINNRFWWSTAFTVSYQKSTGKTGFHRDTHRIGLDEGCDRDAVAFFQSWMKTRASPPEILISGYNVFPFLIPQIKEILTLGHTMIRTSDVVAQDIITRIRPHAICFFNITNLSEKRLSIQCSQAGIPVVCYQHGFGYNVEIQPKDEGNDQAYADYFLAYGTGSNPRNNPLFPVKARFVPVGSARIERIIKEVRNPAGLSEDLMNILWIAETTTKNTHVATLTEDTKRYRIQKRCLEVLSAHEHVRVVYRPLPDQVSHDGTSCWIRRMRIPTLSTDSSSLLEDLINNCNLVISDISSPTTWAEVIGLKKPLILFCDPLQTLITDAFALDLEKVCIWCKSEEELYAAIDQLVTDPGRMYADIQDKETDTFIEKYILHKGSCALETCRFLRSLKKDS
jgi:hypothetical protein